MRTLTYNLTVQLALGFALAVVILAYSPPSEAACNRGMLGRGCVISMGSCQMDPGLYSAARSSGYGLTSCCRTQAYQTNLRACGYQAARVSNHVSGNAVDLAIGPRLCTARNLRSRGLPNVCPIYHANHCHVALCGNALSRAQAAARARQREEEARRRNGAGQSTQRPRRAEFAAPVPPQKPIALRAKPVQAQLSKDYTPNPFWQQFYNESMR